MKHSIQTTIRTTEEIIERCEALINFLSRRNGLPAVRADVMRESMIRGLESLENEAGIRRR